MNALNSIIPRDRPISNEHTACHGCSHRARCRNTIHSNNFRAYMLASSQAKLYNSNSAAAVAPNFCTPADVSLSRSLAGRAWYCLTASWLERGLGHTRRLRATRRDVGERDCWCCVFWMPSCNWSDSKGTMLCFSDAIHDAVAAVSVLLSIAAVTALQRPLVLCRFSDIMTVALAHWQVSSRTALL